MNGPDGNRDQAAFQGRPRSWTTPVPRARRPGRHGRKRAAVAVGHTLLGIIYRMLKFGSSYRDLGPEYLERLEPGRMTRQLVGRLERLGYKVTLEARDEAA